MATTIQIKREEVGDVKDLKGLMAKLSEDHKGEWVAILKTGDLVSDKNLEAVYSKAKKRKAAVTALFYMAREGELMLPQVL